MNKTTHTPPPGYKRTPLGWIPEEWEVKKLMKIGKIGTGTTPDKSEKKYWVNGTIPWLPTGKVNEKVIRFSDEFITEVALEEYSIDLLPEGTILIALIGQGKTRGKAALLMINAWVNQNFAYIIPSSETYSEFLFFLLDYQYKRLRYEGKRGGTQGSLNGQMIKKYKIPLPPLPPPPRAAPHSRHPRHLGSRHRADATTHRRQNPTKTRPDAAIAHGTGAPAGV